MSNRIGKIVDKLDKTWSELWLSPILAAVVLYAASQVADTIKKHDPLPPKPPGELPQPPKKGWDQITITKPRPYMERNTILEPHIRMSEAWLDVAESVVYKHSESAAAENKGKTETLAKNIQILQNIIDSARYIYIEKNEKIRNESDPNKQREIEFTYEKILSDLYEKMAERIEDCEKHCTVIGPENFKKIATHLRAIKNRTSEENPPETKKKPLEEYMDVMAIVYETMSHEKAGGTSVVIQHVVEDIMEGEIWKRPTSLQASYRRLPDKDILPVLEGYPTSVDAQKLRLAIQKTYQTHAFCPLPPTDSLQGLNQGDRSFLLRDILHRIIVQNKTPDTYKKTNTAEAQRRDIRLKHKKRTLEIAYGIEVHTGKLTDRKQSQPADTQRQIIMIEHLQRGLILYPKKMVQHMNKIGLSIGLGEAGPLHIGGWSSGESIHVIYTDNLSFLEIVLPHEVLHSFDFIDPSHTGSGDKNAELSRENGFFGGLNKGGSNLGYVREYSKTNTDEDEATVAENFTVKSFHKLLTEARDQEKMGSPILRYKIEALIGCRVLFDKDGKIAIGKKFESGADYTKYFRDKTTQTTGDIEYYLRWSGGKMDQIFWGNLLAGNQPLWTGDKYEYIPYINADRLNNLQETAIQPMLGKSIKSSQ